MVTALDGLVFHFHQNFGFPDAEQNANVDGEDEAYRDYDRDNESGYLGLHGR